MYHLWKESQVPQEVFKGVLGYVGKILARPKLSLNLIWQLSEKDNKKYFTNILMVKGRVRKTFALYWMW